MTATRPFNILFVCAGNTARSPFAAACALEHLRHLDGAVVVRSAGTHAVEGQEVPPETLKLAEAFSYDLSGHRARTVTAEDCREADLILALGWDQVSYVWSLVPDSWDRCFTVKEFVHYARRAPRRPVILFADARDRMRDAVLQAHEIRRRARSDHGFWGDMRPHDHDLPEPEGLGVDGWTTFAKAVRLLVGDSMRLIVAPEPGPADKSKNKTKRKKATRTGGGPRRTS